MQKKAAIIQDVSCLGKCSAGVALPIVSRFDVECALLPTALLSAHTAFEHYTCMDLTDMMRTVCRDWRAQGVRFDGVYSGYMLNETQIQIAAAFMDAFAKPDALILVDPVMGDNGKAYAMLSEHFGMTMRCLLKRADVITPNLTEAALLLGCAPKLTDYDEREVRDMLLALRDMGAKQPMITGVSFSPETIGVAYLQGSALRYVSDEKLEGVFCGTGDTFASVVFGAMLQGVGLEDAVHRALRVLKTAMRTDPQWYGVHFEAALNDPELFLPDGC